MYLILAFIFVVGAEIYSVKLKDGTDHRTFAIEHNLEFLTEVQGYHVFNSKNRYDTGFLLSNDVLEHHKQLKRKQYTRLLADPMYSYQWHLQPSHGIDLEPNNMYSGQGIKLAIVDDGLQHEHPDIKDHYVASLSFDFNDQDPDPTPNQYQDDGHGTSAAGVCCAIKNNGHCGQGVAYNVGIVGIRLIAEGTFDYVEAQGLTYKNQEIDIYSCSWGPADEGENMVGPGQVTMNALQDGFKNGRHGKGSIFVWAGGNGKGQRDNGNYDGYANHYATFAIGALNFDGTQSWYSEDCACLLAVTPSSGTYSRSITTIDLMGPFGYSSGECTTTFGGTSSAAPLAAGVIALLLEKKPSLTNRDVQHIIVEKASKVDLLNGDWTTINDRGHSHSHQYGFGLLKIKPLLDYIDHFQPVPPQKTIVCTKRRYNQFIPTGQGLTVPYECDVPVNIEYIEQVLVEVTWMHRRHGQVKIILEKDRVQSILADERPSTTSGTLTWTFNTLRYWGTTAKNAMWKLTVQDLVQDQYSGRLMDLQLKILGY